MGYDLTARNKDVPDLSIGAFSWPILLQETGAGYVIGYGQGLHPGQYVYTPSKSGASPVSNDDYPVSAAEAKCMAIVLDGWVKVQEVVNKQWDEMNPVDKEHKLKVTGVGGNKLYRRPIGEHIIILAKKMSEFCKKSGGFKIG